MVIDFREIRDGHSFENFCMHLLRDMGLNITVKPAIGPDSGRDLVCEEQSMFGQRGLRWLVSCKHFAHSSTTVGVNHDAAKAHKLTEHGCDGFMFLFSTSYTEPFRTSVDNVCRQIRSRYIIYNNFEIENILLSSPRFYPLIKQYFPLSHDRLIYLKNKEPCCNYLMPYHALYAIYTKSGVNHQLCYEVLGECCINDYIDHLNNTGEEYGWIKIQENLDR